MPVTIGLVANIYFIAYGSRIVHIRGKEEVIQFLHSDFLDAIAPPIHSSEWQ